MQDLLADRAALLILDDVWRSADADAFDVLGPRCKLLLTTRDAGLVTARAGTHYQVQLPTEAEALALLASAARVAVDSLPLQATAIVVECGRLPLALALCGGMVQAGTPWSDLLDALREHEIEFLVDAHAREELHRNLWRAMEVSVSVLPEDQRRRFAELAVFPPGAKVPEAAVLTLWAHTGGMSERHARRLLVELTQRSLVELDRPTRAVESSNTKVSVHDLLHDFATRLALQRFGSMPAVHEALLAAYAASCNGSWTNGPDDGYFHHRICSHLANAGRTCEMVRLLTGSPLWMRTKLRVLGSDESFLGDLVLALRVLGPAAREDGLRSCVAVQAAVQVVFRLAPNRDEDLALLVRLGRLAEAVGLHASGRREHCGSMAWRPSVRRCRKRTATRQA